MKAHDKPRVERMVPYVRDSFFSGREFVDLAAMRTQAASWSLAVAGQRAARPLGGARPETVFRALEQEHLLALPRRPFAAATWQTAKVAPDCHVSVGGALYSVPFRFIGARLDVRTTDEMLFVYADHELVKSHVRVVGLTLGFGLVYWAGWAAAAGCAVYHYTLIKGRERMPCFAAFRHNNWLGGALFVGIAAHYALAGQ